MDSPIRKSPDHVCHFMLAPQAIGDIWIISSGMRDF
ncbi:unnamed protein product [Gulo gulo]|uniref:Uncharacterized protein n=1 Tax=Gulo gulo TaxID=48420 RepID=A0A9X9QB70_GULGU|nr:unnamed protein product [Gulo gulo]